MGSINIAASQDTVISDTHFPEEESSKKNMACLTEELIKQYQDAFAMFDRNQSGTIQTKNLSQLLRAVGENPSDADVQDMMIEVDGFSKDFFKFPSFLRLMDRKQDEINAEEDIREAFATFDMDGNGYISRTELGYVMDNIGMPMDKEEIECLINDIDIDGDGLIDYEEFYSMMSSK